jgi:hypothetical protein
MKAMLPNKTELLNLRITKHYIPLNLIRVILQLLIFFHRVRVLCANQFHALKTVKVSEADFTHARLRKNMEITLFQQQIRDKHDSMTANYLNV